MLSYPIERHHRRVKLAHQILPNVVYAMLVVPLVHLRDAGLGGPHVFRDVDVVVLPDVVEAMDGVGPHGSGRVTASCRGGILDGCEVVADAQDIRGRDTDLAIWVSQGELEFVAKDYGAYTASVHAMRH